MAYSRPRPGGTTTQPTQQQQSSGGFFSNLWQTLTHPLAPFTGGPGAVGGKPNPVLQGLASPAIAVYDTAEGAAAAVNGVTDFLKLASWLVIRHNWLRAVEFVIGAWFIVFGMRLSIRNLQGRPLRSGSLSRQMLRQTPLGRGPLRHVTRTRNRSRSNSSENSSE